MTARESAIESEVIQATKATPPPLLPLSVPSPSIIFQQPYSQRFCDVALTLDFYCECDVTKSLQIGPPITHGGGIARNGDGLWLPHRLQSFFYLKTD